MPKIDIDKIVGNEVKEIGSASHAGSQAQPVVTCLFLRIFTSTSAGNARWVRVATSYFKTVREFCRCTREGSGNGQG